MAQTRPPDEIIVLYCCCEEPPVEGALERECLKDYGHHKRADGLDLATGEWVGFFNSDDCYLPTYIETMLAATDDLPTTMVVYCWWSEEDQPRTNVSFEGGSSTAGNFIIRKSLAREVGWKRSADYTNDATFINSVRDKLHADGVSERAIHCVKDVLYWHNLSSPAF